MKWIHLSHEFYSCVDDEDYERVSQYTWTRSGSNYGLCGQLGWISIHAFLLGTEKGKEIDHINRAPWDNRRSNLRIVEKWENQKNKGLPINPPLPTEQEMLEAKEQRKKLKSETRSMAQSAQWSNGSYERKKKKVRDNKGNIFESLADAGRSVGAKSFSSISACCQGKAKKAFGKTWEYLQ